jgi:hypothetical protein
MKIPSAILLVALCVGMTTLCGNEPTPKDLAPTVPLFRCSKDKADTLLEIVTQLDNVFTEKREKIYFRKVTPADAGSSPTPHHTQSNVDGVSKKGKGIGYSYSFLGLQTEAGVNVTVQASWTFDAGRGTSALEITVPYLTNQEGQAAGFAYSCHWTEVR